MVLRKTSEIPIFTGTTAHGSIVWSWVFFPPFLRWFLIFIITFLLKLGRKVALCYSYILGDFILHSPPVGHRSLFSFMRSRGNLCPVSLCLWASSLFLTPLVSLFFFALSPLYFWGKEKNKISNFSNVGVISRLGNVWVVEMVVLSLYSFPYLSPNDVDIGVLVMRLPV